MNTRIVTPPDIQSEIVESARALVPRIASLAADIERDRRLSAALLDKLHEARLFRLLLPRSSRRTRARSVHLLSRHRGRRHGDASTAWCLSQAGGCATAAAYLDPAVAHQALGDPRAVLAWAPGPTPRRSRSTAAIGSAACGPSPAAVAMPPGWARTARSSARRPPAARRRGRAGPAHDARTGGDVSGRYLGHHRLARYGQRSVRSDRSLRARRPLDHARLPQGVSRARPALPHARADLLRVGVRGGRARHRARVARRVRRCCAQQGAARHEERHPRQCSGSGRCCSGGSAGARRACFPGAVGAAGLEGG